ncbi:hypothetical protein GCM10027613_17970 [Microlunatus endophyticus]
MQLGMIGLGRMGANIVRRLMRDGHECVVSDTNPESVKALVDEGAVGSDSLEDFVGKLSSPKVVWVMIPAGITGRVIDQLEPLLSEGDIIIDGGNSNYHDDVRRSKSLSDKGIHFVDVGTSGGVYGLERGYCLMVGGSDYAFQTIEPLLATIAPGPGRSTAPRAAAAIWPRRRRATCTADPPAPGTSSRWCTTASSTGSWPPSPRA